jgi:hypothetical protein
MLLKSFVALFFAQSAYCIVFDFDEFSEGVLHGHSVSLALLKVPFYT